MLDLCLLACLPACLPACSVFRLLACLLVLARACLLDLLCFALLCSLARLPAFLAGVKCEWRPGITARRFSATHGATLAALTRVSEESLGVPGLGRIQSQTLIPLENRQVLIKRSVACVVQRIGPTPNTRIRTEGRPPYDGKPPIDSRPDSRPRLLVFSESTA